jgi:GntR family transcriptional regulator, rspAB operon transcriptional repressor
MVSRGRTLPAIGQPSAASSDAMAAPSAPLANLPLTDLRADHLDLADRTYQALRDLVVTRALPAGAKVSAETLSQRFGVSRTTVKDAINQLAAEGLLLVRPQVGTFVRGLTEQDVREIWDARAMIESHAVRTGVAAASPAQLAELRAVVDAMAPLVEAHEYAEAGYERFVALDRRLHELVVETAASDLLLALFRQVNVYVHIVNYRSRRGLRRADLGLQEHRAIADAYEQRDAGRAAEVATRHITRSRDVVLQAITQHGAVL